MLKRFSAILLSVALFLGPIPRMAGQDDDGQITTPCNAHLASITSTEPNAYEKYFEWNKVPRAASQLANEKLPNTVETIAVAPITPDEYKTIFVRSKDKAAQNLTEAQSREVAGVQATLKSTLGKEHGDRDFDKDNYKKVLQAKAASFVIVIGHNEHGSLRLLDGNILFLDDVVRGARPDQRVILISCDSAKQVSAKDQAATINREVTYDEAFGIAGRISAFIKGAAGPVSLAEVQSQLAKDEEVSHMKKLAFFVMKAVCAAGTAIVIALIIRKLDPCKDKDSAGCSENKKKSNIHTKDDKYPASSHQIAPANLHPANVWRAA
jgi:hypothetical protein